MKRRSFLRVNINYGEENGVLYALCSFTPSREEEKGIFKGSEEGEEDMSRGRPTHAWAGGPSWGSCVW